VVHPGLALALFVVGTVVLYFGLRPRRGWLPRVVRVFQMSDRVRIEDALKHLLHCETLGLPPTTDSVAGALEVSRGRATELLARLDRMNLARSDGQGHRLTEEGRTYALRLIRTHRLLERYFADRTGMRPEEWHEAAERQEHQLSAAQTDRLARRMGHPLYDPHGDPIPSASGELPPAVGVPLPGVTAGATVRVVHIEDEPREVYDRVVARGLTPGLALRVTSVTPSMVRFLVNGRDTALESILAANVEVVAAPAEEVVREPFETLAALAVGEWAEVLELSPACQGPQRRRLLDLGVVPGTRIRAVMASASGDPMAFDIRGATIALRRAQAEWIAVRRVAGDRGAGEAA
jgi:DtxR family transcriptional regulator, Mn-dependent transcriptional regulator